MANVQCDGETPCEPVAHRGHAPRGAVGMEPMDAPAGQLVPIDLATPRGDTQVQEVDTGSPSPEAVVTWTEEMATSLPTMRTIRHQPRRLMQRTCASCGQMG